MAKDPAFLFYPSDFLTGSMFMSNEQLGIYIRLLCSQHQHGGCIDKVSFNSLVGNNDIIKSKFIETEVGFYNERLAKEMEKRNKKSSNISEAVKVVWDRRKKKLPNFNENAIPLQSHCNPIAIASKNDAIPLQSHCNPNAILMGIENEDINIDIVEEIEKEKEKKEKEKKEKMLILEMMKIWEKHNPNYFKDIATDYPACLQIAYKIEHLKKWEKDSVLFNRERDCLRSWEKIVIFIKNDSFMKSWAIKNVDNQFQMLNNKMREAKLQTNGTKEVQPKIIL